MINLTQGESLTVACRLKNNRVLVDLADWDIKAAVRKTNDGPVLYEAVVTKTTLGTFTIALPGAATAALAAGPAVLAVRLAKVAGAIRTINQQMTIHEDINW